MKRILRQTSILVVVALGHVAFVVAADGRRSDTPPTLGPLMCPYIDEPCALVSYAVALGASNARSDVAAGRLVALVQAQGPRDHRAAARHGRAERQEWDVVGLRFELRISTDAPECWRVAYMDEYAEQAVASLRSKLGSRFTPKAEQWLKRQLRGEAGEA
jgi:hypothetical protein